MNTAEWTSLKAAGLTWGSEFSLHGDTARAYNPAGRRVRVEHSTLSAKGVRLVDAATGEQVAQCSGLGTAKWWIAQ